MQIREYRFKEEMLWEKWEYKVFLAETIEHPRLTRALIESMFLLPVQRWDTKWTQRDSRLLEILANGRTVHLADNHNRLVYSLEALSLTDLVIYTTDFHDDFGANVIDLDEGGSNSKMQEKNTHYLITEESRREGVLWSYSSSCCNETNYLAYLFWHKLAKRMKYLAEKPEDVSGFWHLSKDRTKSVCTICQYPSGTFYYPQQVPIQHNTFEEFLEEERGKLEDYKKMKWSTHFFDWMNDPKQIEKKRQWFENEVNKLKDSKRLTVEFPILYYANQPINPELPCGTNIDVDYWMNREDLTDMSGYTRAIDLYVNRCMQVLLKSQFIFTALSGSWIDKDADKTPDVTLALIERIISLPRYEPTSQPAQPSLSNTVLGIPSPS